jgi:hypothetical protein
VSLPAVSDPDLDALDSRLLREVLEVHRDWRGWSLREINARDLKRQFFVGTFAERGYSELRSRHFRPGELGDLLRHHHIRGVSNPAEIIFRDGVDALLDYCGLAEVALHGGHINTSSDQEFWQDLNRTLSQHEVRRYYEEHYCQVLPTLLRRRLQGALHEGVEAPAGPDSRIPEPCS